MTTDFDWSLTMKNLGMTGGLVLVASGLLANAFVTLDDDVQATVVNNRSEEIFGGVSTCSSRGPEAWFDLTPQPICGNIWGLAGYFGVTDLNGDRVPERPNQVSRHWNGGWKFVSSPSVSTFELNEGVMSAVGIEILFDWEMYIESPDESYEITLCMGPDVDGDGRGDMMVKVRKGVDSYYYWHRNITAGDALAADINHDGIVDGIDLAIVLASWTFPG